METSRHHIQQCFWSKKPAFVSKFNQTGCCWSKDRPCFCCKVPAASQQHQGGGGSKRHNSPLPQEKGDLAKLLPADILNTTATKYAAMPSLAWYPSPGGGTAGSGGANAVAACCSPAISHGLQLAELPSTVTYRHPSCSSFKCCSAPGGYCLPKPLAGEDMSPQCKTSAQCSPGWDLQGTWLCQNPCAPGVYSKNWRNLSFW